MELLAAVTTSRLLLSAVATLAARHHPRQRQRRCLLASRAHLAPMELLASWARLAPMDLLAVVATSRLLLSAVASLAARYYHRQRQQRWLLASRAHLAPMELLSSRAHLAPMEMLASWVHFAPMEMLAAVATSRLLLSAVASLAARYYHRQR